MCAHTFSLCAHARGCYGFIIFSHFILILLYIPVYFSYLLIYFSCLQNLVIIYHTNRAAPPSWSDSSKALHSILPASAARPGRQGSHVSREAAPIHWLAVPRGQGMQVSDPVAPCAWWDGCVVIPCLPTTSGCWNMVSNRVTVWQYNFQKYVNTDL